MYDVRQALQILIHTSQLCLEKDVHALHKEKSRHVRSIHH